MEEEVVEEAERPLRRLPLKLKRKSRRLLLPLICSVVEMAEIIKFSRFHMTLHVERRLFTLQCFEVCCRYINFVIIVDCGAKCSG